MGNGCVAEDLALRQEPVVSEVEFQAWRENILHGSLTDEQCRRSAKGSRFWSTAILAVGPAGILPAGSRPRRRDAREPHRLEACATPRQLSFYRLFVTGADRQTSQSLHWSSSVCPLRIPYRCNARCLLAHR